MWMVPYEPLTLVATFPEALDQYRQAHPDRHAIASIRIGVIRRHVPVGFIPTNPLDTPPASTAVDASATAVGAELAPNTD